MRKKVGHSSFCPTDRPACLLHASSAEWRAELSPRSRSWAAQTLENCCCGFCFGITGYSREEAEAKTMGVLSLGWRSRGVSREQGPGHGCGCCAVHLVLWNLATHLSQQSWLCVWGGVPGEGSHQLRVHTAVSSAMSLQV